MKTKDIHQQILKVAEHFIQTQGYNAFSYRDIADAVGIKTSSIHYYFPSKADLGKAIVQKHIAALSAALAPVIEDKKLSSRKKLNLFIDHIIENTYLDQRKMCLGGMLASDVLTLPDLIQKEVQIFFKRIEEALKHLLLEAIEKKEFKISKKEVENEAIFILSLLEGSLLLARLFQDEEYLKNAKKQMLARFI